MKKSNYLVLQILLAILLLGMGILIELRGQNTVKGVAYSFLVAPGFMLLLTIFTAHIKYQKHYQFLIVSGAVLFVIEVIIFVIFGLYKTGFVIYLILLAVIMITVALCFIFYIIYLRVK